MPNSNESKLEWSKPIRLRSGWEYRLYATDGGGAYPILGAFKEAGANEWALCRHTAEGKFHKYTPGDFDLVNVPEERTLWFNFHKGAIYTAHSTRELADSDALPARTACVKLTWHDGNGL